MSGSIVISKVELNQHFLKPLSPQIQLFLILEHSAVISKAVSQFHIWSYSNQHYNIGVCALFSVSNWSFWFNGLQIASWTPRLPKIDILYDYCNSSARRRHCSNTYYYLNNRVWVEKNHSCFHILFCFLVQVTNFWKVIVKLKWQVLCNKAW